MHSNPGLLPLQRSTSNEDYRYGKFSVLTFSRPFCSFSDYYAAARGRPPSASGLPPGYDMPGKTFLFFLILVKFILLGNANHLMSPLQPTSTGYNPMVGAPAGPYGHPYGSAHPPPPPPMPGLPPSHLQSHQQNPHMISVQNGPVILVSNLNEDVS
jgi:hypothetical protein